MSDPNIPAVPSVAAQPEQDDEIYVIGSDLSPMPTLAEGEAVWRAAYIARLVERGIDVEDATACCLAGAVVFADDPREAADAELETWEHD